jgi:hypothetical protein
MMPDLPINSAILPSNEAEVNAKIKWLQYLQGGGLSILIAVVGLSASGLLFKVIMDDRDEDRQELRQSDKEFREAMLEATIEQTKVTSQQTSTQHETNRVLDETKDAIVSIGDDFKELAEEIKVLSENEKHTAERLNRVLEKTWNQATPLPTPEPPK